MKEKKILLVVAFEGYQSIEYNTPKKLIYDSGYDIVTASNKPGVAIAHDGTTTEVDITLDKVDVGEFCGIFFAGGPGALENLDNETSYHIIRQAVEHGKPLGAICLSTRILAHAGVLQGKKATGWNNDKKLGDIFHEYGVEYIHESVVVDGNIITAVDPKAAQEFGEKIVIMLQQSQSWG